MKPTDLPRWSTDVSNESAPTSGQMDTGFTLNQVPTSSTSNWWMRRVYLWCAWLDGLFGVDGTLTLDANASLVLSGTGVIKHPARTMRLGPADFVHAAGTITPTVSEVFSTSMSAFATIPLPVGARLLSVVVRLRDGSSSILECAVRASDGSGGTVAVGSPVSSTSTGAYQDVTLGSLNTVIAANTSYALSVIRTSGAQTTSIIAIDISWDQP